LLKRSTASDQWPSLIARVPSEYSGASLSAEDSCVTGSGAPGCADRPLSANIVAFRTAVKMNSVVFILVLLGFGRPRPADPFVRPAHGSAGRGLRRAGRRCSILFA